MTDLSVLLLILVLIEGFVIVRFELRFDAYLRTVQAWTSKEERRVNRVDRRVTRVETVCVLLTKGEFSLPPDAEEEES